MWTLARKLLLHDRLRFAVAIAGVSVSVMLVLVQVGLYFGFMDTASSVIDASTADLWVGKAGNESFEFASPFDERAYYKIASVAGVERAERVVMNFAKLKIDRVGYTTEIAGVRAQVVAMTQGIRSFTTSPIVFADLRSARSFMPGL